MTIQNTYYTDTTANTAGIPTATAGQDNKEMFIEDKTDFEIRGSATHFVQPQATPVTYLTPPPGARQPAQSQPQSSGCNSRRGDDNVFLTIIIGSV